MNFLKITAGSKTHDTQTDRQTHTHTHTHSTVLAGISLKPLRLTSCGYALIYSVLNKRCRTTLWTHTHIHTHTHTEKHTNTHMHAHRVHMINTYRQENGWLYKLGFRFLSVSKESVAFCTSVCLVCVCVCVLNEFQMYVLINVLINTVKSLAINKKCNWKWFDFSTVVCACVCVCVLYLSAYWDFRTEQNHKDGAKLLAGLH